MIVESLGNAYNAGGKMLNIIREESIAEQKVEYNWRLRSWQNEEQMLKASAACH